MTLPLSPAHDPTMHVDNRTSILMADKKKSLFPLAEGIGIFVGVIAWNLLSEGYVGIDKAFFIAVPVTLLWFAWRCRKNRTRNK